ncbi:MAG TPA: hypothetical protein VGE01_05875 [Fimbriimonas sp.]
MASFGFVQAPRLKLEIDGGSAEVVAVCRIEERIIECWHPDGTRFEKLESDVAQKMSKHGGTTVSFRHGKKNRYIFIQTRQRGVYPNSPSVNAVSAGTEPGGHTFLGSFEEVFGSPRPDEFSGTTVLHTVTPHEAAETNVKVRIGRLAETRRKVSLRPGSTFSVDGHRVKVTKLVHGSPWGALDNPPETMWTLYYELVKADDRDLRLGLWLPDDTGKEIGHVDDRDRLVKSARLREIWREQDLARSQNKEIPSYAARRVLIYGGPGETVVGRKVSGQMVVNADPRRLRGVEAFVTYLTDAELGPVPLDPAR